MSTFHGRFNLGYKTDSTQQPMVLGDEFDVIASEYDATNDIEKNTNCGRVTVRWVQNNSGSPLSPGMAVTRDHANNLGDVEVKICGASDVPCGIVDPRLTSAVADGEKFFIVVKAGRIPALVGATAIAKGAQLGVLASGKVDDASGTDKMVALEAGGAVDSLIDIACNFYAL